MAYSRIYCAEYNNNKVTVQNANDLMIPNKQNKASHSHLSVWHDRNLQKLQQNFMEVFAHWWKKHLFYRADCKLKSTSSSRSKGSSQCARGNNQIGPPTFCRFFKRLCKWKLIANRWLEMLHPLTLSIKCYEELRNSFLDSSAASYIYVLILCIQYP